MLRALSKYDPHNSMPIDDVIARFTTLRQDHAHPRTSDKYQHIGTADVLRHLDASGFKIHGLDVQGTRNGSSRVGYEKHLLRFRLPGVREVAPGTTPEVLMRNAHDGTGAWALFAGMFRAFCWNGMVIGSTWGAFKVSHVGKDIPAKVLDASHKIVDSFGKLAETVDAWQGIELSRLDQLTFANQAMQLRYATDVETGQLVAPFQPYAINAARRDVDAKPDLWSTFNRVQENIVTGGLPGTSRSGRRMRTRGLKGIDENLRINRQLFSLAESFAANKAAPNVATLAAFAS